jgi:hypothetical protein
MSGSKELSLYPPASALSALSEDKFSTCDRKSLKVAASPDAGIL